MSSETKCNISKLQLFGRSFTTPQGVQRTPYVPYTCASTIPDQPNSIQPNANTTVRFECMKLTHTVHSVAVTDTLCGGGGGGGGRATSSLKANFYNDSLGSARLGNAGTCIKSYIDRL